ncbi:MAG: YbjN domain-containing protein [Actinomycetota bacterium]|nr:YbjN domain-containing protein [Actinomycetota bacterium]
MTAPEQTGAPASAIEPPGEARQAEPAEGAGPDQLKPRPAQEPEPVVKLRELIEAKLTEMLEGYSVDKRGSYVFGYESAQVFVVPAWLPNGSTVVRVFAITNLDVPVTAQLTSYLLEKNLDFVLGSFALDADEGAVWFNHNLLGQYLAPEEFEATVAAVAQTSNELDDEIKNRFGGRLFSEEPTKEISPPHTPGYL